MKLINSVLGPLKTEEMGFTLMHEHLLGVPTGISQNYPELLGENYMERIVRQLKKAKENGINTIVDASTFDIGRDVLIMAEASRRSGVNIIACSGWYHNPKHLNDDDSPDRFAQLFIREIQMGICGTGIKAGILKSAADYGGITPEGAVMLRAVARAHVQTGVPILLHSYSPGEVGRQQIAILKEEGVDLRMVKIDHSLDTTDTEYLSWLLEQGCYLGMERYPGMAISIQARAKTVKTLVDAGWSSHLLPSHDCLLVRWDPEMPLNLQQFLDTSNPHGLLYWHKVVFPILQEMGLPDTILNSLFSDNPRNFFEGTLS